MQAGTVGPKGGQLIVTPAPKTRLFPGVTRNGVELYDAEGGFGFRIAAAAGGDSASPAANASVAVADTGITMDICPDDYKAFTEDLPPLTCGCSADAVKGGAVWGANPYTAGTHICRAALQAGAVGPKGGQPIVTPAPKTRLFPGVTRNGVELYDAEGGFGFRIAAAAGGDSASPAANASVAVADTGITMDICPDDYKAFTEDSPPLTCGCSADAVKGGAVWGANPYTAGTHICRAALQAGAVGPKGGQLIVTPAPKTRLFPGVTRNGVELYDAEGGFGFRIAAAAGGDSASPAANASVAVADTGITMDICPDDYKAFTEDLPPLTCGCSADAVKGGAVWGANPYTAGTHICRAALQAGAVGPKGGQPIVTPAPKTRLFPGVTRNGVELYDAEGGFGFRIAAAAGGDSASPAANASVAVADTGITMDICPDDYKAFTEDSPPLTCGCSADAVKGGAVWGANPYTAGTHICRAALQAGAVGPKGGQLIVTPAPKTRLFPGVTRNGVELYDAEGGFGFHVAAVPGALPAATAGAKAAGDATDDSSGRGKLGGAPDEKAVDAMGRPIQAPIAATLKSVGRVQVYINFVTDFGASAGIERQGADGAADDAAAEPRAQGRFDRSHRLGRQRPAQPGSFRAPRRRRLSLAGPARHRPRTAPFERPRLPRADRHQRH